MSIFKKVTILFLASLLLMILIAYQSENINRQKSEAIMTQKYLQDARKIFGWIAVLPPNKLNQKIAQLGLQVVDENRTGTLQQHYTQPHTFGDIRIVEDNRGRLMLRLRYLDDILLLWDETLQKNLQEQWLLRVLLVADIGVLVLIFLIILKLFYPLKEISRTMKAFSNGAYQSRVTYQSSDEIGEVAQSYNTMAERLEQLITAREQLLRNVGHELRTPISKGYFAVEKLTSTHEKEIILSSFKRLDQLSSELLELERLHAHDRLQPTTFDAETLILTSLSKLMLEDESKVEIKIVENFEITGDLNYLSTALKNLIDNALKYTDTYPITLKAEKSRISVSNSGKKLLQNIEHYLHPFVREEKSSNSSGYGLGLSIVKQIIKKHGFKLDYAYRNGRHHFIVDFRQTGKVIP